MAQYRKDVFNLAKGPGQAIHDPRVQEDLAREASARADSQLRASIQNQLKQQSLATSAQQNQASQFAEEMAMRGAQMRQQQGQFDTGLEARGQESDAQRQFQQLMQQAGFDFQGEQAGLGREHQAGMQEAGFGFQEQQGDAQRQFQSLMQQAGFGEAARARTFGAGEAEKGRKFQGDLQREGMAATQDRWAQEFNRGNIDRQFKGAQWQADFNQKGGLLRQQQQAAGHQGAMLALQNTEAYDTLLKGKPLSTTQQAELLTAAMQPGVGAALGNIFKDKGLRKLVGKKFQKQIDAFMKGANLGKGPAQPGMGFGENIYTPSMANTSRDPFQTLGSGLSKLQHLLSGNPQTKKENVLGSMDLFRGQQAAPAPQQPNVLAFLQGLQNVGGRAGQGAFGHFDNPGGTPSSSGMGSDPRLAGVPEYLIPSLMEVFKARSGL